MCGIAGVASAIGQAPETAVLDRMAQALSHRGPDGCHSVRVGAIGLAHARLAIVDLTTGDQPLYGPDGLVLVANGEIYNDLPLRQELSGRPFRTGSDCEAPLFLYHEAPEAQKTAFASRLRGMYAIALADPARDRVVLCRDPFGIKPLYIAQGDFGVAFASEPCALLASGLLPAARVETAAAVEMLNLQFSTGSRTPLQGIERLLPGETVVIERGRIVSRQRRFALSDALIPSDGPLLRSEDEALAALEAALLDSVTAHQRSDVPYGMFLSGGVDSATVLALMSRLNDQPVRAFTAGFPGSGVHDERSQAALVAKACGAEHSDLAITEQDFWRWLPSIVASLDDPVADYAVVPTWLLARQARQSVKVILSGEGGDELFAGYGRYRAALRPWPFAKPMRRRGTFDGLGVLRAGAGWRAGLTQTERAIADAPQQWLAHPSRLKRLQAADVAEWLPNDLLTKLDRCLMAHGVEGRVPFLDPVVAGVAMRLDDRLTLKDNTGKWLLRRWLDKALPQAQPFARKKGFTVPVGEWIARDGARLGEWVAATPAVQEIADPAAVRGLFVATDKDRLFAAWSLLVYALWARHHLEGQRCDGDVASVLAAA
ncbi:asparagine synthase (glutamine-hydrolyzing) [Insolitispirillum peregrinum]|uniref:asparagine synthase (glutamine-hydrolyzing) n=1 Tax=Insolitispirillum peregrinum TaxID=80876 RepID=A0A1N7LD53_9PROT|nr:asparagine synthase (glutamine-hydrolyzing) [Insolitispirillum peregrinum]SIS71785.1 asparagine synthase (glutamine-hydrolysing) [Insolitispirillum peregrinum]